MNEEKRFEAKVDTMDDDDDGKSVILLAPLTKAEYVYVMSARQLLHLYLYEYITGSKSGVITIHV